MEPLYLLPHRQAIRVLLNCDVDFVEINAAGNKQMMYFKRIDLEPRPAERQTFEVALHWAKELFLYCPELEIYFAGGHNNAYLAKFDLMSGSVNITVQIDWADHCRPACETITTRLDCTAHELMHWAQHP